MAEFQQYLDRLSADPGDGQALAALESVASQNGVNALTAEVGSELARVRKSLLARGELDLVGKLLDLELAALASKETESGRRADLLLEKGELHADSLLEPEPAMDCYRQALELRPDDEGATESLAQLEMERDNWEKFVKTFVDQAEGATDRQLSTHMYWSAARLCAHYQPAPG
ncbi:MAG: hypothetical protein AAGC55_23920, partial [Myxococcota bacterium]